MRDTYATCHTYMSYAPVMISMTKVGSSWSVCSSNLSSFMQRNPNLDRNLCTDWITLSLAWAGRRGEGGKGGEEGREGSEPGKQMLP